MPLTGKSILVVEDELIIATLIEAMLEDLGCTDAAIVSRKHEAFNAIKDRAFSAVILDVNLDGVDCDTLAEELLAKSIPFVFSTGYGSADLDPRWQSYPILQKPFDVSSLERALAKVMR